MFLFKYMAVIILVCNTYCLEEDPSLPMLLKSYFHNFNETCDIGNCSSTGRGICIRASSRTENTTIYLTAPNICQVNYANCHKDLFVKIVPNTYCTATRPVKETSNGTENSSGNILRKLILPRNRTALQKNRIYGFNNQNSEPDEPCPSSCPTSDRMVCGRCQHGVHRSFLSACHLRMYACAHEDERPMELVSRSPCPYSAPYMSDPGMAPGDTSLKQNDDIVLRFTACREKHHVRENNYTIPQSFKDDPECQFGGSYSRTPLCLFCCDGSCNKRGR